MQFDEYEATIAQDFVCAIEYGDYSGTTSLEDKQIKRWLKQWPSACFEYSDNTNFARCDICDLWAHCVTVKIFVPVKAA